MNSKRSVALLLCSAAIGALVNTASAQSSDDLANIVDDGTVNFDFRYRTEYVDQDGFDKSATASTLRSRLTLESGAYHGLSLKLELDDVTVIGSERYNSTENGKTEYPVVADPTGFDFNQASLHFKGENFDSTYGRQRINHGNQRFVGGVGWRQNEQTYDGFRARWQAQPKVGLDYSYIYNVSRLFGPDDSIAQPADLHGKNHFLRVDYLISDEHTLAAFGYFLEFDSKRDPSGNPYASGKTVDNSTNTWGIEYRGEFGPVNMHVAYATQADAGQSTKNYRADYYTFDLATKVDVVTLSAGIEVLGAGDNQAGTGFKTPLATLHKFQGWADLFLTTPNGGVEDLYARISGALGPVKLQAIYHDFSAENSSHGFDDYGSEIDLAVSWPVSKVFTANLNYAKYEADEESFAKDREKIWLTLQLKI